MADPTSEEHQLFITVKKPACHPAETANGLIACIPDHIETMSVDQLRYSLIEANKRTQRLTLATADLRFEYQRLVMHINGIKGVHELEVKTLTEHLALARKATAHVPVAADPTQGVSGSKTNSDTTATTTMPVPQLPVFFKDTLGREFKFPYDRCCNWKDMKALMRDTLDRVEYLEGIIDAEHYDLIGPDGETISPRYYEDVVYPGMKLQMVSWSDGKFRALRSKLADASDKENSDGELYWVEEYDGILHSDEEDRMQTSRPRPPKQDRSRSSSIRPRSPRRTKDYNRVEDTYELVEREDCSWDDCQEPRRPERQRKKARKAGRGNDRR